MKKLVKNTLTSLGYEVRRAVPETPPPASPEPPNPIHLWETDAAFAALYETVHPRTLVDRSRCFILYQLAGQAANLPGEVAEIGVYKGGTARLLSRTLAGTPKQIHLFDTFAGMPDTDPDKDWHRKGDFQDTSLESVSEYLADCPNVVFHQGFFPQTAGPVTETTFALAHIDVDIYVSVIDCCEFFYPRMSRGGFMVFDDYGFVTCPGAKEAVDAFFADKPEQPCYLPTGQCLAIKI
jgi:O-methyltransferase